MDPFIFRGICNKNQARFLSDLLLDQIYFGGDSNKNLLDDSEKKPNWIRFFSFIHSTNNAMRLKYFLIEIFSTVAESHSKAM